jgi:CRP-like cAMP-binding protein
MDSPIKTTHEELQARFPALTRSFDREDSEALGKVLAPATFKAGETLMAQGSHTDTMYLVERGLLSVFIEAGDQQLILGQARSGMVVGEIAMIEPGPASATVSALEDTAVLSLGHEGYQRLLADSPKTASILIESLSLDLAHRLRHAGSGLLRRIDERHWMKVEAQRDRPGWMRRLATILIGGR